ncbi:hypothetical protein [Rhizobium bangladeshense]|uniref:hypothetical protein n=1 Tax=Rhizobium bangladeshense TaxID=1138189 RepID=UPI0014289D17|nr:hypothetical protein [Rhizobium bangladeshense]
MIVMKRHACQRKGGIVASLRRQRLSREIQNARIQSSVRIRIRAPRVRQALHHFELAHKPENRFQLEVCTVKSGAKIHEIMAKDSPFWLIRPNRRLSIPEKALRIGDAKGVKLFHVKYIRPPAP